MVAERRRALLLGAEVEPFSAAEIYERDNWTCGICNGSIDRAALFPHPQSASLDHIVPLSLGGAHKPSNVRATHLYCNASRGNRVEAT